MRFLHSDSPDTFLIIWSTLRLALTKSLVRLHVSKIVKIPKILLSELRTIYHNIAKKEHKFLTKTVDPQSKGSNFWPPQFCRK